MECVHRQLDPLFALTSRNVVEEAVSYSKEVKEVSMGWRRN